MRELTIEALTDNLAKVLGLIDEELEAAGCPMKIQMQIDIAVEEIFVNVARYAYSPATGNVTVQIETVKPGAKGGKTAKESPADHAADEAPSAIITFTDSGVPYDPLAKADPDVTLPAEERQIGGLGIYMVKKSMDDMKYEYKDGHNILTLIKKLS
ncbi:MAG: ATP-binding protein [Lachnospiraceae bacterium]|nr:ATP-binding protein [Lachnospiraceae bacterium]